MSAPKKPKQPKPPTPEAELGGKLLAVLASRREFNPQSYMLPLEELLSETGVAFSDPLVTKTLKAKPFKDAALIADPKQPRSPVALKSDLAVFAASDVLLEYAKETTQASAAAPAVLADFKKAVTDTKLKPLFEAAVKTRIASGTLPEVVLKKPPKPKVVKPKVVKAKIEKPEVVNARKLVSVLQSQRELGNSSYPLTLARLGELTDVTLDGAALLKAAAAAPFKAAAVLIVKDPSSLVALIADRDRLAADPRVVEGLLRLVRTADTQIASLSDLSKKISDAALKKSFLAAIERQLREGTLPATVAYLREKKAAKLFLLEDLLPVARRPIANHTPSQEPARTIPTAATTHAPAHGGHIREHGGQTATATLVASDFADAFSAAFEKLDRQTGGHNFVKLVDLRRHLSRFPRDEFDAGLRELRIARQFSLSAAQSKFGISAEERAAGIEEAGALLSNVSRSES